MKTLYLQCDNGVAGDMLLATLVGLTDNPAQTVNRLNALGFADIVYTLGDKTDHGIVGNHMRVTIKGVEELESHHLHDHAPHHHHHHSTLASIGAMIDNLKVNSCVKANAKAVYTLLANAESLAHGCTVEEVHFHEVGAMDAVADIVGVCYLMNILAPQRILASPIAVGSGTVTCAHGVLPVPAPATLRLLENIPIVSGVCTGELATPTGVALLLHFVNEFGPLPSMSLTGSSLGLGTKHFSEAINGVYGLIGDSEIMATIQLSCNIDDMTGEDIGFATQILMEAGALDVWTTAISMKKGRPGILLDCLCEEKDRECFTTLLFKHTSTLGIRENPCVRHILSRRSENRETKFGVVGVKVAEGYGVEKEKVEFEDMARIARRENISLTEIKKQI